VIMVDRREKDMVKLLPECPVVELEYGDYCIYGNGPEGAVTVGVERKKVRDLITSMMSGRMSGHQIPGMSENYFRSYLIVEGEWKEEDGEIWVKKEGKWKQGHFGRRKVRAADIWTFLTSLEVFYSLTVRLTRSVEETVDTLRQLDRWWGKPWNKHNSIMMKATPATRVSLAPGKPSLVRRVAVELPGIGIDRAKLVEKEFRSVVEMVEAPEHRWEGIPGIGKQTARMVVRAVRGEE
jgi:ERCC4-type nuclease